MLGPELEATFRQLVAAFAGRQPLPAGGAAGVVSVAMGVGLGLKVIDISQPSGRLQEVRPGLAALLERIVPEFGADCAAFARLLRALRLRRDDARRAPEVGAAWREATAAPVSVAVLARDAESRLTECREHVKPSVRADLDAALDLVRAGRRIAERNAHENAARLDASIANDLLARLDPGGG